VTQITQTSSTIELFDQAAALGAEIAAATGALLEVVGELERREAFREEGATSMAAWVAERLGVADSTGRAWVDLATGLWDLPCLARALCDGEVSFDKAKAAASYAEPETDAAVVEQIKACTVRQVQEVARSARPAQDHDAAEHHEGRYLRFNPARRTLVAQLPADQFARVQATLTHLAESSASDGETPWDQRLADALVARCQPGRRGGGGSGGTMVVVHAALSVLQGGSGVAELEHLGLLSPEAARRLMCGAEVALALDDAFGHTMYEGRATRFATDAQRREVRRRDRHCRFPGCANDRFTQVHHIIPWKPDGLTDLDNLALLCDHHHHRVHEGKWAVSGNANGVLRFMGPTKRLMTSRPSPLWTRRR
jgi:hypothetical protein